jgi:hypothetical protein
MSDYDGPFSEFLRERGREPDREPDREPTIEELEALSSEVILMMRKKEHRVNISRCMSILKQIRHTILNEDATDDKYYFIKVEGMTKADIAWLRQKSPRFTYNSSTMTLRIEVDN